MPGHAGGHTGRDEGLADEVGPVQVHQLQAGQHEGHEEVGQAEHLHLDRRQVVQSVQALVPHRVDAAVAEEQDAAPHPRREGQEVENIEDGLAGVPVLAVEPS